MLIALLADALDEPQPLIDAARDLGEHVGRIQVAKLVGFVDRLSCGLSKGGQSRRQGVDMAPAVTGR